LNSQYLKYYKEIERRLELDASSDYAKQKLRDNRITHFLHFALYTYIRFEYTRVGVKGKGGTIIRRGNSGTRVGTCDLTRVPSDKQPKGPPLSQAVIIRYYDNTRPRKDWRSFYRRNFIASFAWLNDETGRYTTNPAELVESGQVPPPSFNLSRGDKRRVKRIIKTLNRKNRA
jgi:hypothetical protein